MLKASNYEVRGIDKLFANWLPCVTDTPEEDVLEDIKSESQTKPVYQAGLDFMLSNEPLFSASYIDSEIDKINLEIYEWDNYIDRYLGTVTCFTKL